MSRASRKPPARETQNALLGDLESIRSLLETDSTKAPRGRQTGDETDIPILDDVVEGALEVDEASLTSSAELGADEGGAPGLADETFDALLGDQWRQASERILQGARRHVEQEARHWSGDEVDELTEALKLRVDEALNEWLSDLVSSRIDELSDVLSEVVRVEVEAFTTRLKESQDDDAE